MQFCAGKSSFLVFIYILTRIITSGGPQKWGLEKDRISFGRGVRWCFFSCHWEYWLPILHTASSFSTTTGIQTDAMICGTRGSGRLSISVVILRETFVHLVLVLILVLTDHRLKTWVIIQWYFSKKDIVKHESGKSGSLKMYVSTWYSMIRVTSSYGKFERSLSQNRQVISALSINGKIKLYTFRQSPNLLQGKPPSLNTTIRHLFKSPFPPNRFILVEHTTPFLAL